MRLRKQQRFALAALVLVLSGTAAALVLTALGDKVAFFVSPTDIASGKVTGGRDFRLGGLVVAGSIAKGEDGMVRFSLTDNASTVEVAYRGVLPDLFREGQGIVAQGRLGEARTFEASEVLAKHDEAYMPTEVAEALKRSGHWQPQGGPSAAVQPGAVPGVVPATASARP